MLFDGFSKCQFDVGSEVGMIFLKLFFEILANSFHCIEIDGVNDCGYDDNYINV